MPLLFHTFLQAITLLLPALVPSWRFFDVIAPSPRIEFTLLNTAQDLPSTWQEFRTRPTRLSMTTMLKRMFFNPSWNESLFLVSCAERLMQNETQHSQQEILQRICTELRHNGTDMTRTPYVQFRLVFVNRDDDQLQQHITYISHTHHIAENAAL